MDLYEKLIKIDFAVQVLLMTIVVAMLGIGLFNGETDSFAKVILIEVILGIWQVVSAFLIGTIYKNEERWKYLKYVGLYFISLFAGIFLSTGTSIIYADIIPKIMLIFIPIIYAFCYLFRTYADLKGVLNRPRSFWDLT